MSENTNKKQAQAVVIEPIARLVRLDLKEMWQYRHILWRMIHRDIRLQFDDLFLGFFWATALPLAMLFVFTMLKRLSRANLYETLPYSLYVYSGLVFWFYFRGACVSTMRSIAKDVGTIKKVYFPRLLSPIAPVISNLYSLAISLVPLIVMMITSGVAPGWRILL